MIASWVVGIGLVVLAAGLMFGRFYVPHTRPLRREAAEGRNYARGLVRLVEGDDKAAIAELTDALKRNSNTVEAYFALGSLFRQQGEHERAVRVHQSLLVRRDVDKSTRLRVHYQLAQDFRAAGFPRRAIKALQWLITQDRNNAAALRDLGEVLQSVGQWDRAAAVYRRLGRLEKEPVSQLVAHLLAQAAQTALTRGDLTAARALIKRGAAAGPGSAHVLHVMGLYHQHDGNPRGAFEAWRRALDQAPELLPVFEPLLKQAVADWGRPGELDKALAKIHLRHPGDVGIRLAMVRMEATRDVQGALTLLSGLIEQHPQLLPARLEEARLQLRGGDALSIRKTLEELLLALDRSEGGYLCGSCGHCRSDFFWRCAECATWGSGRPASGRRVTEKTTS